MFRASVALICLLATAAVLADVSGRVINVYDGSTIMLELNERTAPVRLAGIAAPAMRQPYSHEARMLLSSLVYGRYVRVIETGRDSAGLISGQILLGSLDVNLEMVRQGAARCLAPRGPTGGDCQAAELRARAARRGLWDAGATASGR